MELSGQLQDPSIYSRYSLKKKMGEAHSCIGRFAGEGNLVPLREISP